MSVKAMLVTHDLSEESMLWMDEVREVFDELVIFIDSRRVTPRTPERAAKVATRVHQYDTVEWYQWDLGSMVEACQSDWVFLIERDEQLSAEWKLNGWRKILQGTELTHFWIPRRWVVPGGRFISAAPWWPDCHPRLFRSNVRGTTFPTRLHDTTHVPGGSGTLRSLAIHHHVLRQCSRPVREERMRYYEQLRPGGALEQYYLYEDHAPPEAPLPEPTLLDAASEVINIEKLAPGSISRVSLTVSGVPREMRASTMYWIEANVANSSDQVLSAGAPHPTCLAYHWIAAETRRRAVFEGIRTWLFPDLQPNASGQYSMTVVAPPHPGDYILQVTMVQEGICWFEDIVPEFAGEFLASVRERRP
jgi:hypothetical protein